MLVDLSLHMSQNRLMVFAQAGSGASHVARLSWHHGIADDRLSTHRSVPRSAGGRQRRLLFRENLAAAGHFLVLRSAGQRSGSQRASRRQEWLCHVWLPEQLLQGERWCSAALVGGAAVGVRFPVAAASPARCGASLLETFRENGVSADRVEFVDRASRSAILLFTIGSTSGSTPFLTMATRPPWIRSGWAFP